jgi:Tfp pilus assembly protein PilX
MSLVVTLLIVMFLIALGIGVTWYASLHLRASASLNARQVAANAARAGIEHARMALGAGFTSGTQHCPSSTATPWSCDLGNLAPRQRTESISSVPSAANPKGTSTTNPPGMGVILFDDTNILGASCSFTAPCPLINISVTGAAGGATYTVWVRNDPADINAGNYTKDTNSSVIVRSVGVDPTGTATVVMEAGIAPGTGGAAAAGPGAPGKNLDAENSNATRGTVVWPTASGS